MGVKNREFKMFAAGVRKKKTDTTGGAITCGVEEAKTRSYQQPNNNPKKSETKSYCHTLGARKNWAKIMIQQRQANPKKKEQTP